MAWAMHASSEGEFGPEVECLDDIKPFSDFKRSKRDELGLRGLRGFPVPEELAPRRFQITRRKKKPDFGFFSCPGGLAVDDRVRDAAEAIEPGVHQFFPIDITMAKTGEPLDRPHFLLHCCTVVDSVDPERSNVKIKGFLGDSEELATYPVEEIPNMKSWYYVRQTPSDKALVIRKSASAGRALWWDNNISDLFFSDPLCDAMAAQGVVGWDKFSEHSPEA